MELYLNELPLIKDVINMIKHFYYRLPTTKPLIYIPCKEDYYHKYPLMYMDWIDVLTKHNGYIFGGYVRNIIVPVMNGKNARGYKDIDVWFQNQHDADNFAKELDLEYNCFMNDMIISCDITYPFSRAQYFIDGVVMDIIVCDILPVNDLNVNQLVYNSNGFKAYGLNTEEQLIALIVNRRAKRLIGYRSDNSYTQQIRMGKLKYHGWIIR